MGCLNGELTLRLYESVQLREFCLCKCKHFEVLESFIAEHFTQGIACCDYVADLLKEQRTLPVGIDNDFRVGAVECINALPVGNCTLWILKLSFDTSETS